MQKTTRIKLFLKHYMPTPVFSAIRYVADRTLLKIIPFFFHVRISDFKQAYIKEVYFNGYNFRIEIKPENGFLDAQIHANGLYEPHIVEVMHNNISAGNVCIDVGANIGHHTILMSHFAGDTGHVYAYEPIPSLRDQMARSLAINNIHNVTIRDVALSDTEGKMKLHIRRGNIGGSSLVDGIDTEELPVHVSTLDQTCFGKVDFMKIDVEGYEYHVLQGGRRLIEKYRPTIIFEWSPIYYRIHNSEHTKAILMFFKTLNYELIDIEDGNKIITQLDNYISMFDTGMRSQTNILAIPL